MSPESLELMSWAKDEIHTILPSWWKIMALDETGKAQGVLLFRHIFAIEPEALEMFSFKDEANLYES